ncbi:MAG TPA: hypothetical protein VGJ95_09210 [Pseudonocardiaceae bacterium]
MVGIEALHIRLQIRDPHPGRTLHVHQWQPASGDEALDGAQRNPELLGGFGLRYQ